MNNAGAVHRDRGQETTLEQIDDERREADFERVCAHAQHDRPLRPYRSDDPLANLSQVRRRQDARQRVQKITHTPANAPGDAEGIGRDLALPLGEWIRHYPPRIDRREFHRPLLSAPKSACSTSSQITCAIRM